MIKIKYCLIITKWLYHIKSRIIFAAMQRLGKKLSGDTDASADESQLKKAFSWMTSSSKSLSKKHPQ